MREWEHRQNQYWQLSTWSESSTVAEDREEGSENCENESDLAKQYQSEGIFPWEATDIAKPICIAAEDLAEAEPGELTS